LRKHIFVRNLLFVLIVIYFLQGLLYRTGSIISQLTLAIYFLICLYYFIEIIPSNKKNPFVNSLIGFLLMILLYYLFSQKVYIKSDGEAANTINYLKGVLFAFLTFFPFYFFSKKGCLKRENLIIFFIIYGIITVFRFFYSQTLLRNEYLQSDVINNAAYDVLSLFPFIFLIADKKILSSIVFILLFSIVLMGIKRGAILIALIATIIYVLYLVKAGDKFKFRNFLTGLILLAFLGYFLHRFYSTNVFLQSRLLVLLEGGVSGRDVIYSKIYNYWKDSENMANLFFGYGLWSSIKIAGNAAHNDWLELLSNCGIMGVLIYLSLFYLLYISAKKTKELDKKYMLLMILIIWFMKTLFSMAYMEMNMAPLMMLLGYIFGNEELNNNMKIISNKNFSTYV